MQRSIHKRHWVAKMSTNELTGIDMDCPGVVLSNKKTIVSTQSKLYKK